MAAYALQNDYHQDFVVRATDGTHWIIEIESRRGSDDQVVQRKTDARCGGKGIRLLARKPGYFNRAWWYANPL